MANVVVKENHLTFGGVRYFRGQAEEVELGSIGEKRTPITGQNYLEVKDRIPPRKFDAVKSTVVDIDFSRTSSSAFDTAVSVIVKGVPVNFSGAATFNKLRSGELKLVKFSVSNNEMKRAANNSPRRLNDLINWGNDARIAHQVFVVMEASLANSFDNNATVDLSVGTDGLEGTVSGNMKTGGATTVQISEGTGFAYLLAKIDWDARQKKNRTRIVDLDDDQWGVN